MVCDSTVVAGSLAIMEGPDGSEFCLCECAFLVGSVKVSANGASWFGDAVDSVAFV